MMKIELLMLVRLVASRGRRTNKLLLIRICELSISALVPLNNLATHNDYRISAYVIELREFTKPFSSPLVFVGSNYRDIHEKKLLQRCIAPR